MPHFDEWGGDEWICQAPGHRGNRIQNSRVKSEWRPDITGHKSAGNCCPPCIQAFDSARAANRTHNIVANARSQSFNRRRQGGINESAGGREDRPPIRQANCCGSCGSRGYRRVPGDRDAVRCNNCGLTRYPPKPQREPINPLDYADNPAELEFQREFQRLGVENSPQPTVCPKCKGPLESHPGMVGEQVLVCGEHGIVWEDSEGAIRNVY